MKYIFIAILFMFASCNAQEKNSSLKQDITTSQPNKQMKNLHQFTFEDINGDTYNFADLKGKKVLIVNTASKCGYTKQYDALEKIHQQYQTKNFIVIGFPSDNFGGQEFDNNEEIANFCKLNYGVSFPLMTKSDVKGENPNEIFQFLTKKALNGKSDYDVKWNFTKFLINPDGSIETSYPSSITPDDPKIINWIENK